MRILFGVAEVRCFRGMRMNQHYARSAVLASAAPSKMKRGAVSRVLKIARGLRWVWASDERKSGAVQQENKTLYVSVMTGSRLLSRVCRRVARVPNFVDRAR